MAEHLSSNTIDFLAGKRLAPEDLLKATRHLATCVECRKRASEAAQASSRAQAFAVDLRSTVVETAHLAYEQLEGYIDDSLEIKDRETVKRHLGSCVVCSEEVRGLESLRDNLTTYPARADVNERSPNRKEHSWERIRGLIGMRPVRFASMSGAFALIAVITALVIWRPAPRQMANTNSAPTNNDVANQNSRAPGTNTNVPDINHRAPNSGSNIAAASPYESVIAQAIETQRLSTPTAIRDLTGKQSQLLGSADKPERFALISPVGTVIRNSRPTFRWQTLPGATSYSVAILDLDLNLVEKSSPAAKLSWTPLHQLKPNVVYIWQVTAVKEGREIAAPAAPAREARFKVLTPERSAALSRVSTEVAGSHLKLGIVYAREGLLDDAEREFRAAIAANQDAALARRLLQSVRQMRH